MSEYHNTILSNTAAFQTAHSSPFSESITYTPKAGSALTLTVEVYRNQQVTYPNGQPGLSTQIFVPYSADASLGITEVNVSGDKVTMLAHRDDTSTSEFTVAAIVSEDACGWLLEIR